MRSNRYRDTKPELSIRRLLHARGYRYRVDFAPWSNKRRRADIVFTRWRLAVFIDGCFWHGCPEHGTMPATHADYWGSKLAKNIERDMETTAMAEAEGWTVLRIWEHVPPKEAVYLVAQMLERLRDEDGRSQ
jgi:DNA mismatch endonuclease vsr